MKRSEDLLAWILDEKDYKTNKDKTGKITYKIKHEISEYPIKITSKLNGQKATITLKQKRVLFYSADYAEKAKYERDKLIAKAYELIKNPSQYNKQNAKDASTYIKKITFTKEGEIATNQQLEINEDLIKKEEQLDGYYLIVTSETELEDEEIIKIYRGLWEIEETFSIMKGVLKVRPVFSKSIEAHILISFVALLILRLLQKVCLKEEYTAEQLKVVEKANKRKKKHKIRLEKINEIPMKQIVNFIRSYQAVMLNDKYFVTKYNDLIPTIEKLTELKLDKHCLTENEIKKFFDLTLQRTKKFSS